MELPKPELPSKVEELPKIQAQIKQQLPPMKIPAYMFGIDCMAALVKGHKIQGIDGSIFIVEKIRSKDEDTSLVRCTKCNRLIQKKSIPSHINSRVHQLYVERETS